MKQDIVQKIIVITLALTASYQTKATMDYNGNPLNTRGSITITPHTSAAILASYTQSINTAGLLDKTFGTLLGSTLTSLGATTRGHAMTLQSDGKIVVAGFTTGFKLFIARYTTTGTLDSSFGTNGSTLTGLGDNTNTQANAVTLQPDGKIVVAGFAHVTTGGAAIQLAVARYTTTGILDTTFGTGGSTLTPLGDDGTNTQANAVTLQPDGKIVVAGFAKTSAGPTVNQLCIARYTTDGALDTTFGTGGSTLTPLGDGANTVANAMALQSDGKVVVTGSAHVTVGGAATQLAVARYTTDGALDLSFGTGGSILTSLGDGTNTLANAMALQSDGKIVVTGSAHVTVGGAATQLAVARYTTDGALDPTFGTGGSTLTSLGNGTTTQANAVTLQPDGKIVVTGSATTPATQLALARYTTTGILDPSFGTNGSILTSLGNGAGTEAKAIALQADDKIIATGSAFVPGQTQAFVARYINPFTLATFTESYGSVGLL